MLNPFDSFKKVFLVLLLISAPTFVFACSAYDPPATYASVSSCIKSRIFMKPTWLQKPPAEHKDPLSFFSKQDQFKNCISSTFMGPLVTIGSASSQNGDRYWLYYVKVLNPNDPGANAIVPAYEVKQIETCTQRFLAGPGPQRK